ncbi:MAG: SDR family oxidoreductase [Burkholderiales bacterium]|nr:SDR family oxidoreductase [Burkholderiales bacterium]
MTTSPELNGRVALITGAAKNIGRAIALELAAAGATVAINTRASRAEAEAVAAEIRAAGGSAAVYIADIADAGAVQRMCAAVAAELGAIDILVLNASVRREIPFTEMTFEEWRQVMAISLDGAFHCVKAVLPGMISAGGGHIITLAGDTALTGAVGKVHSSSAKSGLAGMTRALARELGPKGIRVNCVSPGHFNTTRPAGRAARPAASGHIPLGRYGEADEIAATVRFLCGRGGGFTTGQIIHVNGGQWMF